MQNYTRIYLDALGFDETDFIPCEISGKRGQDIHHIIGRGKKGEDRIENLMAVTRQNHIDYGDKKFYMSMLFRVHKAYLRNNNVTFDAEWIDNKINEYETFCES